MLASPTVAPPPRRRRCVRPPETRPRCPRREPRRRTTPSRVVGVARALARDTSPVTHIGTTGRAQGRDSGGRQRGRHERRDPAGRTGPGSAPTRGAGVDVVGAVHNEERDLEASVPFGCTITCSTPRQLPDHDRRQRQHRCDRGHRGAADHRAVELTAVRMVEQDAGRALRAVGTDHPARHSPPAPGGRPRPPAANSAARLQLDSGTAVITIGGFAGADPAPTLTEFQTMVSAGQVHYDVVEWSGPAGSRSEIADWVAERLHPDPGRWAHRLRPHTASVRARSRISSPSASSCSVLVERRRDAEDAAHAGQLDDVHVQAESRHSGDRGGPARRRPAWSPGRGPARCPATGRGRGRRR